MKFVILMNKLRCSFFLNLGNSTVKNFSYLYILNKMSTSQLCNVTFVYVNVILYLLCYINIK